MSFDCRFFFIFATLIYHSSASFCGGQGEYVGDGSGETFTPNNASEFVHNLKLVLIQLPNRKTNISLYSWAGVNSGVDPNAAYAQARCIGYVDNNTCLGCIKDATAIIEKDCSEQALSAFLWHGDYCMVQYSIHNVIGIAQMPDSMIRVKNDTSNLETPSSADSFFTARSKLFDNLVSNRKNNLKFAAGKWYDRSSNKTIYGAVQCSWDLPDEQCDYCLTIVNKKLREFFDGKIGGSIVGPSCNIRYEVFNFMNDTTLVVEDFSPPLSPPSPSPSPSTGEGSNKALLVIYIVSPLAIISIILFFGIRMFLRKREHNKDITEVETVEKISDEDESGSRHDMKTEETLLYDFSSIRAATENFSEANKLGQGGFGVVFKGNLQNGDEIAVKRLSQSSKQGELEFKNEVTLLAKLQHRNLVRLLGFCLKGKERLLIYEFVANSSLDNYIFDPIKRPNLNWDRLYKIIGGVARGLLYLHEDSRLRIIHRDLKSSNILLDDEMTPKIADFGMAKLFLSDETQGTSKIVGTYGYMAPEYLLHGLFSIKSDVFSFGVLILEIICGHRNTSFRVGNSVENLLSYAWKSWQEGTVSNLIDPALISETSEATRCVHIGLLCAQEDASERPTMASVVNMLSNLSTTLTVPSKPFFQQCSINQTTPLLQEYDSGRTGNSSGSKNKSSSSWTTDTELHAR